MDGSIFVWRLANFEVLKEFSAFMTIYDIILPRQFLVKLDEVLKVNEKTLATTGKGRGEMYLMVKKSFSPDKSNTSEEDMGYKCVVYDYINEKVRKKVSALQFPRNCTLVLQSSGDHLVVANKRKVMAISCESRKGPKFVNDIGNITCIAWNQGKSILITGHERREIALWHNAGEWIVGSQRMVVEKEKKEISSFTTSPPVHTLLHWHAHSVRSLRFSTDGAYIFSGGEEAVQDVAGRHRS